MNDTPTFEMALAELEQLLRALEDGSTTLEAGLAGYERGVELLKLCYAQLQQAEQRIALLANLDAEGKPVLKPFDHASSAEGVSADQKRRPPLPKPTKADGLY